MSTVDLTSKMTLKPANLELTTDYISGELPLGQSFGGLQAFSSKFIRGYGDRVFGSDDNGIWLGKADFADAPFSVDMEGSTILGKATVKDNNGTTVIDGYGLTSTNFNFGDYTSSSGFNASTNSWEWTDITSATKTFSLNKTGHVLFLVFGTLWSSSVTYQTSWVRLALNIDGSVVGYSEHENYDAGHGGIVTSASTCSFHNIALLSSGSHTAKLQISTDGLTTNGHIEYRGMSYLILGT